MVKVLAKILYETPVYRRPAEGGGVSAMRPCEYQFR